MKHPWSIAMVAFVSLFVASLGFAQGKPRSGPSYLTVEDVQKITGISGLQIVPPDPSKGAGGDINFANKEGKLVLMVQRMLSSDALYSGQKQMKSAFKADVAGVGDAAFSGPAGPLQYFITFKKGKGSGSVATFLTITGTELPLEQVKKVAAFLAAGM